jgi:hypothetical protein
MAGPSPSPETRDAAFYARLAIWVALILGWLTMLLYAWSAFATFPSAERLEQSRMAPIPTLRSLAMLGARSAVELTALLVLTWPWRSRAYTTRLALAAGLLVAWFVLTAPLTLSMTEWVHRRWLAAVTAGLILAFLAALVARGVRAGLQR